MRFEVVPMREIDLEEIVEIEESTGLNRWGYDAYRRELLTNPHAVMYVARSLSAGEPAVLGFVAAALMYDELHINNIASRPEIRRRGIGRALLRTAIDEGRLRGASFCVLEVRASNVAAQELYRAFDFTISRRRKDYYRAPVEDALEMVLKL